jgi:hypothetical protein
MRRQFNESRLWLRDIFSVENILGARGFTISSTTDFSATFVPSQVTEAGVSKIYQLFGDETTKRVIRDHIEGKPCSNKKVEELVHAVSASENYHLKRKRLSTTFEWYVGELIVREFKAFSSAFGVQIANMQQLDSGNDVGDYDALVVLRNLEILYLECKMGSQSANGLTSMHVMNAMSRGLPLHCAGTVLFLEQGVGSEDLLGVLKSETHPVTGLTDDLKKICLPRDKSKSMIFKWFDCYFVNANERYGDVTTKLRTVFRVIGATSLLNRIGPTLHAVSPPSEESYQKMGYLCETVRHDNEYDPTST